MLENESSAALPADWPTTDGEIYDWCRKNKLCEENFYSIHKRHRPLHSANWGSLTTHLMTEDFYFTEPDCDRKTLCGHYLPDGERYYYPIKDHPPTEKPENYCPKCLAIIRRYRVQENMLPDQRWRDALANAGSDGPVVVANSDDPLVVWAASDVKKVIWVDTASTWTADAALCPQCGSLLQRDNPSQDAPTGAWDCPGCDLTEPPADYRVRGTDIELPSGERVASALNVPGAFNVANAACALAAAVEFGVSVPDALAGFSTVRAPAGRFAVTSIGDSLLRLVLSKNPAGWSESLPLLSSDPVILAIDSVAADGKDVSWLWDVDFEQLRGRRVICSGPRAYDLAVRLEYGDVTHEVISDVSDAVRAVRGTSEPVDVIATYTPFQKLLKMAGLR